MTDKEIDGRYPVPGSGSQASPGAAEASPPTVSIPNAIIATMTAAQKRDLAAICRTSGGGLRISCKVMESGEVVPSQGPIRKLYEKGLIQGKSGAFERVVHTRLGWAVNLVLTQGFAKDPAPEGGDAP